MTDLNHSVHELISNVRRDRNQNQQTIIIQRNEAYVIVLNRIIQLQPP